MIHASLISSLFIAARCHALDTDSITLPADLADVSALVAPYAYGTLLKKIKCLMAEC